MVCNYCHNVIQDNASVCPYCGNLVANIDNQNVSESNKIFKIEKVSRDNKKKIKPWMITIAIFVIWGIVVYSLINKPSFMYYFQRNIDSILNGEVVDNTEVDSDMLKYQAVSKSGQSGEVHGDGVTKIIYDNQYLKQFNIKSESDVFKLISTDSLKQKSNCSSNIQVIEHEIITNYGVVAANLCEMDETFALELRDVVKYIYDNYPTARNYLTNITLANIDTNASYMAAFMPVFTFATSNTNNGYPVGVKSQIILNAKYFLNLSKMKSEVAYGSKSGYFPKNATRSSTVAHEFGHYLSYVALLNYYNSERLVYVKANDSKLLYDVYDDFNEGKYSYQLLQEAYQNYCKGHGNISFDEFRSSISKYAMAKDNTGSYIYDETVAEAFHDVYINGNNASIASQYIVNVLISKL